jgi:hypothetical protein
MGSRSNDAKQAFRIFIRNPGFAAVTVAVLAVGIGAATAIFTVFSALMLRSLALPHPEQLVELSGVYRNHARIVISYPMFGELERTQRVFSVVAGWSGSISSNVEVDGKLRQRKFDRLLETTMPLPRNARCWEGSSPRATVRGQAPCRSL